MFKSKSFSFRTLFVAAVAVLTLNAAHPELAVVQAATDVEVFRATSDDPANPGPYVIKARVEAGGDLVGLVKYDQPNRNTFFFSFEQVNSRSGAAILKKKVGFVNLDVVVVKGMSLTKSSGGVVQVSYRTSPLKMKSFDLTVAKKNGAWAAFSRDNGRQVRSMHFVTRSDGKGIAQVQFAYH